jgi:penicillin-binding protein 1A
VRQTVVPSRAARHAQDARQVDTDKPRRKGRFRLRRLWWIVVAGVAILIGLGGGFVYALAKVPLPEQVPAAQVSIIYDSKLHQIGTLAVEQNRRVLAWEDIPEVMRKATLAAEDKGFYEHGAVSYRGVIRAAWANVTGGGVSQGGSTISQQYVKNATSVGRERTLLRKAKEAMLATKLEDKYSKDEILQFYLNTIYFGRGAYGVEAATRTYFGHSVKQGLKPAEAAFLAGAIRSPEFYANPKNNAAGVSRRNDVLAAMSEMGWLSPEETAKARATPLKLRAKQRETTGVANSAAPHFMEKVRLYLIDKLGADVVNRGGLRVVTTLDMDMQKQAKEAVESTLDAKGDPRASLVAIEAKTGAVRAMYAGKNFATRQFNYATDAQRQAGSTMKPFVLAQALDDGVSVESRFEGSSCLRVEGENLCNYGRNGYGDIDLLKATRLSVNTVYLRLVERVGPSAVASLARRCGIESILTSSERRPNLPETPSLALGAGTVSTLQLTSAFSAFANRGVHQEPFIVVRVQNSEGQVVDAHKAQPVRCTEGNVADTVNMALTQVVQSGTGTAARIGRPVAGKTGTTNDNVDARFVGYTPDLVASVWMGFDNQQKHLEGIHGYSSVSGGTLPAKIWHDFMVGATEGTEVTDFTDPELSGEVINPAPPSTTSTTAPPPSSTIAPPTLPPSSVPQSSFPDTTSDQPDRNNDRLRRRPPPPDS